MSQKVDLSVFYPCRDNFLYLEENTRESLKESLLFLSDLPFIEKSGKSEIFHDLIASLSKGLPLFQGMLFNHVLIHHYENDGENVDEKMILADCEHFKTTFQKDLLQPIFPYKNSVFSNRYWEYCDSVITSTFSESVSLETPEIDLFEQTKSNIRLALNQIQHIDSMLYEEIKTFVTNFVVIHSNRFVAGSSFPLIGLVGLNDHSSVETLMDHIVHESAHQYIFHLTVFDELCSGDGLFTSPLRSDPRPIEGVFHSLYVLARLIYFYRLARSQGDNLIYHKCDEMIEDYTRRFYDACSVVETHGTLTELGKNLVLSCKNSVAKN